MVFFSHLMLEIASAIPASNERKTRQFKHLKDIRRHGDQRVDQLWRPKYNRHVSPARVPRPTEQWTMAAAVFTLLSLHGPSTGNETSYHCQQRHGRGPIISNCVIINVYYACKLML